MKMFLRPSDVDREGARSGHLVAAGQRANCFPEHDCASMLAQVQAFTTSELVATPPLLASPKQPTLRAVLAAAPRGPALSVAPYRLTLLCAGQRRRGMFTGLNRKPFAPGDIATHPSSSKRLTVWAAFGRLPKAAVPCFVLTVETRTTLWADTTPPGVALSGLFATTHYCTALATFPMTYPIERIGSSV